MKKFKDVWEDAAANSVSGDGVDMPADVQHSKKKRKKAVYDGRTKEGRKFVERMLARKKAKDTAKQVNASKENQASVAMKEEQELLDEALQHVHTIKIDGNAPSNPKPSEAASIKSDFKLHVQAIRSAVKRLGGLITDTEVPSRQNKFVGKIKIGTRGDASKLSNGAIQKAVKSKGAEIQSNQFMKEFVELEEGVELIDENYRILATKGMGAETKNSINVGRDVDYYDPKNGDKRMGKITKMTKSGYVVKDEKDGKSYTFSFHDSSKAKALLAKHGKGKYNESVKTEDKGQFIYAAKQAKAKGDSTFVFAGKTYNCEEVLENETV